MRQNVSKHFKVRQMCVDDNENAISKYKPPLKLHRTPNKAQNTQHKLGVAFSYLERNKNHEWLCRGLPLLIIYKTRSDLEISQTNSAITSSNGRLNRKRTDLRVPNPVSVKKQLWDVPERRESFTWRLAQVINSSMRKDC